MQRAAMHSPLQCHWSGSCDLHARTSFSVGIASLKESFSRVESDILRLFVAVLAVVLGRRDGGGGVLRAALRDEGGDIKKGRKV